jgi:hypothetical protein
MTVYAYLKSPHQSSTNESGSGEKKSLFSTGDLRGLRSLNKDFFKDNVEYLSIRQRGDRDNGFIFIPGHYRGPGYTVLIEKVKTVNGGSDKCARWEEVQDLFGEFETIERAQDFWKLLLSGEILPTEPLERKLTLTEQAYARQASLAIQYSADIRELNSLVHMLTNQVKAQGQIIQDMLTPKAS